MVSLFVVSATVIANTKCVLSAFRIVAKSRLSSSSCPAVRPSANVGAAPTGWIFMKSDKGYFYKNLRRRSTFSANRAKLSDTLQ
jgi:hypothetical protein